jgi:hypothetical protein
MKQISLLLFAALLPQAVFSLHLLILEGIISESSSTSAPVFVDGQAWRIEIEYDETAIDSTGHSSFFDKELGTYSAISAFRFVSGDYFGMTESGSIRIWNNTTNNSEISGGVAEYDSVEIFPEIFDDYPGVDFPDVNGRGLLGAQIVIADTDAAVFDSDALFTSAPDPSAFEIESSFFGWWGDEPWPNIKLQTTSISLVPEPRTYALWFGLVVLVYRAINRRLHSGLSVGPARHKDIGGT